MDYPANLINSSINEFLHNIDNILNLDYPVNLINSSINEFLHNIDNISVPDEASDGTSNIVVPLPFKDQKSANSVKREMQNLSAKIGVQIKPVFQSKKISQVLSLKEKKPPHCKQSVRGLQISI